LAAADVSTMLLLHPPGQATLPLAIFTVMANAPESLVASLCLLYVVLALAIVSLLLALPGSDRP
jgi:ABC-type Fe3+ transport system permease subunit